MKAIDGDADTALDGELPTVAESLPLARSVALGGSDGDALGEPLTDACEAVADAEPLCDAVRAGDCDGDDEIETTVDSVDVAEMQREGEAVAEFDVVAVKQSDADGVADAGALKLSDTDAVVVVDWDCVAAGETVACVADADPDTVIVSVAPGDCVKVTVVDTVAVAYGDVVTALLCCVETDAAPLALTQ